MRLLIGGAFIGAGLLAWVAVSDWPASAAQPEAGGSDTAARSQRPPAVQDRPWHGPPKVAADANASVASVVEAVREKKHPERVSLHAEPAAFDAVAFERNPRAYLDVPEPGRVFQVLPAAPGVRALRAISPRYVELELGDTIELSVKSVKGMPVTFTSVDLGAFENGLTTITVEADNNGKASATFTAVPGTVGAVTVLAGSPVSSGNAQFSLMVTGPEEE